MKDLVVIIPIEDISTDEQKEFVTNAVKSVDDSNVLFVGSKSAIESLKDVEGLADRTYATVINSGKKHDYASQVMCALKSVKSKYFSVLEFDDTYSDIWFKNVATYIENDNDETFAFFPLTEVIDCNSKMPFGYANEAVWASSFSDEIGCFDIQSFEDYFNFNASGAVFKTDEFLSLGGLKPSLKLVVWYEFILRALYKNKRLFVIPKVGYYHTVNRPDSITTKYAEEMTEKEAEWWVDTAKKEYFFPHDRKKTYTEDEE